MSLSLHVGNLPFSVKSRDLASVFENLSGYEDAKVTVDGNSKSRGFGLVTFAIPSLNTTTPAPTPRWSSTLITVSRHT